MTYRWLISLVFARQSRVEPNLLLQTPVICKNQFRIVVGMLNSKKNGFTPSENAVLDNAGLVSVGTSSGLD
jgi:hypothetical protein